MMPVQVVERDGFKQVLNTLDPRYKLPGRKYFSHTALPKLYESCRQTLEHKLKDVAHFATTADLWSSRTPEPYLSMTAHCTGGNVVTCNRVALKPNAVDRLVFLSHNLNSDMSGASNTLAREFLTDVHQLCSAVAQQAEAQREEDEEESHMVALGEYLVQGRGFLLLSTLDSIIDQQLQLMAQYISDESHCHTKITPTTSISKHMTELTCREELLTLLLSLLPLVWKIPVQEEKAPDFFLTSLLEVCTSREEKASTLKAGKEKSDSDAQNSQKRSSGSWKSRRTRRTSQRYSVRDACKSQLSTSDSEANSDEKAANTGNKRHRFHGSSLRVSICQHHQSVIPQQQSLQYSSVDTMSSLERSQPHVRPIGSLSPDNETLTDPTAVSVLNRMENSPFDLCHVLLSLLEKVCKFDIAINHNPGITMSVVPTLTEILTEFGDSCGPGSSSGAGGVDELAGGWTEEPIALVQRMLLRTILRLMSVDVAQNEALPDNLRRSLTDLLRATLKIHTYYEGQNDPFSPRRKKTLQEVQEELCFSKCRHRTLLLPELLEGVLQFLLGCLQASASNPFFFSQALELVHEFVQHHGLELFETTCLNLEALGGVQVSDGGGEASEHLRSLIASVLKMISAVKKAKSEQLHQSVCARYRHRRCEYSHFLHHHHNLTGLPVSAFKQTTRNNLFEEDAEGTDDQVCYPEHCCCLAACAHRCLRLLQRLSPSGQAVLQVLAGVQVVGICCCMNPHSVVGPLLKAFQAPGLHSYQSHILNVLSRFVLEQLGGGQHSEKANLASCNICTLDSSQIPGIEETLQGCRPGNMMTSSASSYPLYISQGVLPSTGSEDMLWKWDALKAYQEIVFGEDLQLSQQVASHLCQLILQGNAVVQWQLYTHIFNPVLQRGVELSHHAQQLGVSSTCTQVCSYHSQCFPVEVLLVYLQTLPALLKTSTVVQDLFLSCNGLNQVTELIYLDCTRPWALKVFKLLILSDWDQQANCAVQELEKVEDQEREAGLTEELGAHGTGDGPPSLSKFYEGLKGACPHRQSRSGGGIGCNHGEARLNTINLFLCVSFLCVSKEADFDRDSANDSEDTSGYDSTASEPLGGRLPCLLPDNVALPSKDQVRRAADVWSVCCSIYLASPVFQRQFFRLGGLDGCCRLMAMVIQTLATKIKDSKGKNTRDGEGKARLSHSDSPTRTPEAVPTTPRSNDIHKQDINSSLSFSQDEGKSRDPAYKMEEEWPLHNIRLLEALLAICLHSSNLKPNLSLQLQSVEDTLCEVKDQLSRSGVVNSDLAVPLFDSLLRVALAEVSSTPVAVEEKPERKSQGGSEAPAPAGDLSEEADEIQECGIQAPGEEEGYEADSESNPEDSVQWEEGVKVDVAASLGECAFGTAAVAKGPVQGMLLFPEICFMELQLLASSSPDLDVLGHVLQSMLGVVRGHHCNAAMIYQQGGVKSILTGFQNVLSQSNPSYKECQTLLVELLVAMVNNRMTAEELALLIRLFLDKTPPTEILLKGILRMVEANADTEPLHYFSFPIPLGINASATNISVGLRTKMASGARTGVSILWMGKQSPGRAEDDRRPMHSYVSPWHIAPLHLPLVGQNCWPHMASGFSASLWVRPVKSEDVRRPSYQDDEVMRLDSVQRGAAQLVEHQEEKGLLHVLSMGSKALMLQVWADVYTGACTFRICIDPNDEMKAGLLAQTESPEGILTEGRWQHLAFSYTEQPEGKKNIQGRLVLWACGIKKCEASLDYTLPRKSSLSSDSNKMFCMLGHCLSSSEELPRPATLQLDIGTLLLFNGSRINTEEAFYLYASGPDLTSIMPCKYGKPSVMLSKYVTQEGLQCEKIRDLLMKNSELDISLLTESLAVVYSPSSPCVYTIYEPVIRLKGQTKTPVASQRPFSIKEVQSSVLEPPSLRSLQASQTVGLHSCLHKIGGMGAFVFLFARVVELSDCERTQALALQVLLSLAKYNQHRIQEMEGCHGYSMIHQVLVKSKCIVGYHILKTLLNGCCSGSILTVEEDGQWHLDTESTAVVQDLRLLSEVLLDWNIWAKAQNGVWETLLAALEILIRVYHPQQTFNIRQLLKAQVVHRFLLTCQVLQENRDDHLKSIPQEVCFSFIKIIQEVLGSPPDLDLLRLLYKFLLAVHPPTNTYVCHTPSSFYFSLHIDGTLYQEKVQSMMHLRHCGSGGKSASSSVLSLSPTPFTEIRSEVHQPPSPEHKGDDFSWLPPSSTPSLYSFHPFIACQVPRDSARSPKPDVESLTTKETLKQGEDEPLLSSCESAKTICDTQTPSISMNVEQEAQVVSSAENSAITESEELAHLVSEEAPRRPDSLKGIQSFQRSQSDLASLGLAFPAQNGSLAIARWPSVTDRTAPSDDWESYTYSPGYANHSKTDPTSDRSGTEDCLVLICCGLYELLRGVLLLLPDLMLEEVMDRLIQPEALIVLVNHSSILISLSRVDKLSPATCQRRLSLVQSDSLLMRMRSVASDELTQMMQRRMSQENPIRASETEFIQRLQRLVVLAVNRIVYFANSKDFLDLLNFPETPDHMTTTPLPGEQVSEENSFTLPASFPLANMRCFQKDLLKLMMEGIKIGLGNMGRGGAPRQQWRRILWSCRETFRVQIGRLLVHTLSPSLPLEARKEALEFIKEQSHPDILRECLSPGLEHGPKLALYLYEMLHDHKDNLTKEEKAAANTFMTSLKLCGHRCIPPNTPPKPDLLKAIKEEQLKYESEERTSKGAWEKKLAHAQNILMQRLDGKSKDISKIAADITQNVSLRQGMERKKVMQHIRGLYKTELSASRHWQELVQQLTHDRAVWYDQSFYPTSWQLDPTEGPNRERRRLQRCYLTIPNKYLLKDRRKPEGTVTAPLAFLFEDKTHSSFSSTVKDKATSEPIRFTRRCVSVAPSRETTGELLLGKSGMYFVEDNAAEACDTQQTPHGETEPASFCWTYEEIKEVHKRWWQLRDNAVEIFLTNGRTLLLAFTNTKFRDDVYHNILTSDLPNVLEYDNINALTQLWGSSQITNFEYLTHLNKHAGRSFNDLMQYPVFPFILKDYTSETLDLQDPIIYRNLSKPIAVQSKEKEDRYVDNYKYLEEEYKKGAREDDPMPPVQPYHYGSHYSNSGTVLHFLVRMPPFTKMFLAYQDQSFDIPDRTFHSMNTTWRLSSYESMTDVKELIPEFFYLPEFLVNREGFDFGVRQNSERVNHVNLPPWARNDPRLFILIHRQALESDQVSQTLCQWIDLVFGLKQKGKAAIQAINVFHPATYFGMDVSAVEDPVQRRALETMIKTYGQTPKQLFNATHISRAGPKLIMEGELPAAMGLLVQLAFRESREYTKEITVHPSPLPWIKGLKWGEYVGSPSAPDPVVCFSQPHGERFGSLLALPTRAICGLSRKFCLMMIYSKEQGVRSMHSTDIQWSAILSWGYTDNMLRLKSKQSEPPLNFIQCCPLHQVTSCAWVPDGCQLFTGSKCGVITAYSTRFSTIMSSEMDVESQVHLYGHSDEVTGLFVCKPYSILISVSRDGTSIVWDLNRLCYVQSLTGHKSPVNAVSASETTGDIATVCNSVGGGSDLRLWTVNGDLIGHVHCREIICSVAFSNQSEGVSVNVIAGGLENGVVRLWSTWDLKPVREITFPKSNKPIISLTFSCDGHHLYTANSDGMVIAWCRRDQQRMKLPMFYSFLSSYAAG
ncbi:hypothetical protein NFI96_016679 [Prochilodus magdalenae]|nr:hypothetical protein NFI96_016679 [Prochilodus magdalenae]